MVLVRTSTCHEDETHEIANDNCQFISEKENKLQSVQEHYIVASTLRATLQENRIVPT